MTLILWNEITFQHLQFFSKWYIAIAAIFGLKSDKIQYIIIPRKWKKFVDVSDDHYNFSFDIFSRYEETCKKCELLQEDCANK